MTIRPTQVRTPEDDARTLEGCHPNPDTTHCTTHGTPWPCTDSAIRYVAAGIRARDAEIAAATLHDAATWLRTQAPLTCPDESAADWLDARADHLPTP